MKSNCPEKEALASKLTPDVANVIDKLICARIQERADRIPPLGMAMAPTEQERATEAPMTSSEIQREPVPYKPATPEAAGEDLAKRLLAALLPVLKGSQGVA